MAEIKYRVSSTEAVPVSTTVKNAPLTNLEIDANFRSVQVDLGTKSPLASPTFTGTVTVNSTTAVKVPSGSIVQRPTGVTGMIRYNVEYGQFEGYGASSWGQIGGGATGAVNDKIFWENDQVVTSNYTITLNKNAGSFGPITVNSGVIVTVPDGCVWTIA